MEKCLDLIPIKSFHRLDFALICAYVLAELVLQLYSSTLHSTESQNFICDVPDYVPNDTNFVHADCFRRYDQFFYPYLSLHLFILATSSAVSLVCLLYGYLVKSWVEAIETIPKSNTENSCSTTVSKTHRISRCHFVHLICRFAFAFASILLQCEAFYPDGFSTEFPCSWPGRLASKSPIANSSNRVQNIIPIGCKNLVASSMSDLAKASTGVNAVFAIITCLEGVYLLHKVWKSRSRGLDFLEDSNFCSRYLLGNYRLSALLKEWRKRRALKENETDRQILILKSGKTMEDFLDDPKIPPVTCTEAAEKTRGARSTPESRTDELDGLPEGCIPIQNIQDLFLPNKDLKWNEPRTILAVGRPKVGKTRLCDKIVHDWSKMGILRDEGKAFESVFLFRFRNFNSKETKYVSLSQMLRKQTSSTQPFSQLLDDPHKILLIFDGLNELRTQRNDVEKENKLGNGNDDVMTISTLFVKLVLGKLLCGATVLTTTTIEGLRHFRGLRFDREAELVGFSRKDAEKYVPKCEKIAPEAKNEILKLFLKGPNKML